MFESLLFIHMFGLSIGAGTGVYLLAVSRHAAGNMEQAEARTLMPGITSAIARVGNIGLVLLVVSGIAMTALLGPAVLNGLFWAKMLGVACLVVYVAIMSMLALRVSRRGDLQAMLKMHKLGPLGPALAMLITLLAVLAFH